MGAAKCASCPAGSWNDDFAKTECTICPQGKWMQSPGSMRQEDCTLCQGSVDCLPFGSARITIEFRNFPYSELSTAQLVNVGSTLADDIAAACGVSNESVVDLQGKDASVSIGSDGKVSAFVKEVTGSSANELASRLYSATFRGELVNSTLAVLGTERKHFSAGAISVHPEKFEPLVLTSTTTRSSSMPTTSTQTRTVTTGASASTMAPSGTGLSSDAASPVTSLLCSLLCSGLVMSGIGGM